LEISDFISTDTYINQSSLAVVNDVLKLQDMANKVKLNLQLSCIVGNVLQVVLVPNTHSQRVAESNVSRWRKATRWSHYVV